MKETAVEEFQCPFLSGDVEVGRAFHRGDTVLLRQTKEMDLATQLRFHEYLARATAETGVHFVMIESGLELVDVKEAHGREV